MSDSASGEPLTAYTGLLRRRWRLITLLTIAGLLLAGAALLVVPSTYTATTAVQVHPSGVEDLTGETAGRTNSEVNLDTEAQVVSSATVATAALELLGQDPTPTAVDETRERVEVTVPPNSGVLEISYAAAGPETAQDTSVAFAEAYLTHRADWIGDRVEERISGLDEELDAKYAELSEADTADGEELAGTDPAPGREETLHAEIDALHEQRTPLAAVNGALSAGEVLTEATIPTTPSSPRAELWLVAGTLLGLVSGLALSFAREHRHAADHSPDTPPVPTVSPPELPAQKASAGAQP